MDERPSLGDMLDAAVPFALPLRRRFRGLDVREGVLIEGPSGWGEFAPFDDYSDEAAARWLNSALEAAFGSWPTAVREQVHVNAIVPEVRPEDAAALTRDAVSGLGCRTIKVKVGSAKLADDEARVAAVRQVLDALLGPGTGAIRLDANAAWDVEEAVEALRVLGEFGLEYVEQPCASADELAALRRRVDVAIAADETIRLSADPAAVRVRDLADVAILKPAPLGGVAETLRVAEAVDMPVVVSGSLDSSVGLDTALAAAAALPHLDRACGLGTGALLADDLAATRLPQGGVLAVGRTRPDPERLRVARDRISPERASWWRQRITTAWSVKG